MRTREDQIEDLTDDLDMFHANNPGGGTRGYARFASAQEIAAKHIDEAERRAEQRVRAEIGRDSERLDWLETAAVQAEDLSIHCLMNTAGETSFGVCGTGDYEETLREAIDAAREAHG